MKVWKEVVRPGIYWYKDRSGADQRIFVTKADVAHHLQNGREMIAAGLSIPVPLEHQESAEPKTPQQLAAQQLLDNSGWVRDYRVHNGVLMGQTEITDPATQKKIEEGSIAWTSPKICPEFLDGNGRTWKNCITHLALTLRPRHHTQKPFGAPVPTGWDSAAMLSLDQITEAVTPSQARLMTFKNKAWVLRDPVLFALEDVMDKEEDKKKKPKMDDEEEETTVEVPDEPEEKTETTKVSETTPPAPGDLEEVLAFLAEPHPEGIHLPPDTNCENFLSHLRVALHQAIGPGKKKEDDALEEEMNRTEKAPEAPAVVQEQHPMLMSLETIAKAGDPVKTAMARQLINQATVKRKRRIAALVARNNDKALQAALDKECEVVSLSIRSDGKGVYDPMSKTLTLLEVSIPNTRKQLTSQATSFTVDEDGDIVELAHPTGGYYSGSKEVDIDVVDRMARAAGYRSAPAK